MGRFSTRGPRSCSDLGRAPVAPRAGRAASGAGADPAARLVDQGLAADDELALHESRPFARRAGSRRAALMAVAHVAPIRASNSGHPWCRAVSTELEHVVTRTSSC